MKGTALLIAIAIATAGCDPHSRNSGVEAFSTSQPLFRLDKGFGVIVPVSSAPAMLHLCRDSPGPAEAYWLPTRADIDRLETNLSDYIAANQPDYWTLSKDVPRWNGVTLSDFGRQYGGVVRHGHRVIIVNLFKARVGPSQDFEAQSRRGVIQVCDGGARFITVEFNADTSAFEFISYGGTG